MEEVCLATGNLAVPARPATKKLSGRKLAMRIMLGALGASVVRYFSPLVSRPVPTAIWTIISEFQIQ